MTERLTASLTSNGSVVSANLDINPRPEFTYTWKTQNGAKVINPGASGYPPNYTDGDGLIQTYTYQLIVHLANYPPGTVVTLASTAVSGFNPANIATGAVSTDGNGNAQFTITFNESPSGSFFTLNPYGNTNDVFAGFTVSLGGAYSGGGLAVQYIVPVLYCSASNWIQWLVGGGATHGYLMPSSFIDVTLAGGGGGGATDYAFDLTSVGWVSNALLYAQDGGSGGTAALIPGQSYPIDWHFQNVSTSYLFGMGAAIAAGGGGGGLTSPGTLPLSGTLPPAGLGGTPFGSAGNTRVLLDTPLFTVTVTTHTSSSGNGADLYLYMGGSSAAGGGIGRGGDGSVIDYTDPAGSSWPDFSFSLGVGGGSGSVSSSTMSYVRKGASAGLPLPPIPIALVMAPGGTAASEAQIRAGSSSSSSFTSLIPPQAGADGFAIVSNSGGA